MLPFNVIPSMALAAAAFAAPAQPAAAPSVAPRTQAITITIRAGDSVVQPNFALAPGVPVRVTFVNRTREVHTFTVPELNVSVLVQPATAAGPTTTVATFTPSAVGTFAWHCIVCPSGDHGGAHEMGGKLYVLIPPSVL